MASSSPSTSQHWDVADYSWDDVRLVATPSMEQNSPWSARSTVGGLSLQGRKQDKVAPISHPVEGEQMLGDEGGRHSAKPPSAVCTTKYGKQARKNLACRIGGCPEICNNAYTARSRVCHTHMKAGKPLRVYPNPTVLLNSLY
jgi:hypothetical protein